MTRRSALGSLVALVVVLSACGDDDAPRSDASVDASVDSTVGDGSSDATESDAASDSQVDGADGSVADAGVADLGPIFCTLVVSTINGLPIDDVPRIDSTLDKLAPKPGFQVDVGVKLVGAPSGKDVSLKVTGVTPDAQTTSVNGIAVFAGVTVNSSFSTVEFEATSPGCEPSKVRLDVQPDPTCTITVPANGSTLTADADTIPANDTFETNVVVATDSRSIGGVVRLEINGRNQGTENVVLGDPSPGATFENIVFSKGSGVQLLATLTLGELQTTCAATIDVDIPGPVCEITTLVAPPGEPVQTTQGPGLGPAQDGDIAQSGLQTTITVTSDSTATSIVLRDGTTSLGELVPSDGAANFAITLNDGPHVLSATCKDDGGASSRSDASVLVDITKPSVISDLVCYTKCLDTTCPIGDPSLSDNRRGHVTCSFSTADGTGSAVARYILRYRANDTIDESKWDDSETFERVIVPNTGVLQSHVVSGFSIPNSYSFAVRAVDVLGNEADISNLPAPAVLDFRTQVVAGLEAGDFFGSPIVAGDFTCDGLTDVAIGEGAQGSANQGRVRIFAGTPNGLSTTAVTVISGTAENGYFGVGLARLDFNGDGCRDLAVWANGQDAGRGRVYLYLGREAFPSERTDVGAGTGAEVAYSLPLGNDTATQVLGQSIAGVDLDGDGNDELAMTHWDSTGSQFAHVLVDYGDDSVSFIEGNAEPAARVMPEAADVAVEGGSYTAFFGLALARGGLLDRVTSDVQQELLIGAPSHRVNDQKVGAVYVVKGADRGTNGGETIDIATSSRVITILGDAETERNVAFGSILAGVGDLDGDGIAEFAAADPSRPEGTQTSAGKVYVFNLDAPMPSSVLDARGAFTNGYAAAGGDQFGRKIASGADIDPRRGADINSDLLADVIVGSRRTDLVEAGSAHVFLGQLGGLTSRSTEEADTLLVPPPGGATTLYSVSLTFLGDVNGDGFVDVIVGDVGLNSNTGQVVIFN